MKKKLLNLLFQWELWNRRKWVRRHILPQEREVFELLLEVKPVGLFCISIHHLMTYNPELFYDAVQMIYEQARNNPYEIGRYISMELIEKAVLLWEGDDEIEMLGAECGFYLSHAS